LNKLDLAGIAIYLALAGLVVGLFLVLIGTILKSLIFGV
jgi:hypothetical protein